MATREKEKPWGKIAILCKTILLPTWFNTDFYVCCIPRIRITENKPAYFSPHPESLGHSIFKVRARYGRGIASGWDSPCKRTLGPLLFVQYKTPRPVFSVEAAKVIYCVRGFINELFNFRLDVYRFQFLNLENEWRRERLKNASYSNFIYRELHIITPRQVTDAWGRLGQCDTLEMIAYV